MTVTAHVGTTRTAAAPVEVGVKHIRWGIGLFIFGLVVRVHSASALHARLV